MLFDSHAHLNFNVFKEDGDAIVSDCLKNGVWVNNVGTQADTSRRVVEMAEKHPEGVYATVGLHPIHLTSHEVDEEEIYFKTREEKFDPEFYRKLARSPKVVAIGECGLEYFRLPQGQEAEAKKIQEEAFRAQIELAAETKKALMVHSRDAYADIRRILEDYRGRLRAVIIHSFIGSWEEVKPFVNAGFYISFNGIITFKPRKERRPGQSDPNLLSVVDKVPLEQILLETDCPYLSPEPLRGARNVPQNVKYVVQKMAEIKKLSVEEVAEKTMENTKRVFGL